MRILIVDDDTGLRLSLKAELEAPAKRGGETHRLFTASTFEGAFEVIDRETLDIVFLDLDLGETHKAGGFEILQHIRRQYPNTVVIIMTGNEDSRSVETALKYGAADYIFKPFESRIVHHLMVKAVVHHRLFKKAQTLRAQCGDRAVEHIRLTTKSPAFTAVLERAKRLQGKHLRVLITGESGTGKEIMAQYLWSLENDPDRPYIPVHCGAITQNLVESSLFGHTKGAFTGATEDHAGYFEDADGGDIFLDEIGTMPLDVQIKTLRTLNSGEVVRVGATKGRTFDFRVIAATNENLASLVQRKLFRDDLLFRLKEVELQLPPLRDRKEDIPTLVEEMLRKAGHPDKHFSNSAIQALSTYNWPGNLRQLSKVVTVLSELSDNKEISLGEVDKHLGAYSRELTGNASSTKNILSISENEIEGRFECVTEKLQQSMVAAALKKTDSVRKAAQYLGVSRGFLRGRLAAWNWDSHSD